MMVNWMKKAKDNIILIAYRYIKLDNKILGKIISRI